MKQQYIDAIILKECIITSKENLYIYKDCINSLDSDKDTGDNIYYLFDKLSKEIKNIKDLSIKTICETIIKVTTLDCRGNIGIAIGMFLNKLSKELINCEKIESYELSEAFKNSLNIIPHLTAKPKKKSIIEVSKAMADRSEDLYNLAYLDDFFRELFNIGNMALENTKDRNNFPDAGAVTFMYIIKSFYVTVSGDTNLENLNEII